MTCPVRFSMVLFVVTAAAATAPDVPTPRCNTIEDDTILARDLASVLPAFLAVPPDTRIGYAPVPGARRYFRAVELRRLATRYNFTLPSADEICFERAMELLQPERVTGAMRQALANSDARIEIVDLSRYPVPRGEIQFARSALSPVPASGSTAPLLWRGFVRYGADHRFAIWARARILVRSVRVVATENLPAGRVIEARQVRLEETDVSPSNQTPPSLDQVVGKVPRRAIAVATAITASLVEEPKDVEHGDVVQVDVRNGGAHLELEGRAQADGRKGQVIPVRNLATGKSFSARIRDKGKVVPAAALTSNTKDENK
jgi:flagella basal body P-ring formation protein FlgA